jgi:hypothetical protein
MNLRRVSEMKVKVSEAKGQVLDYLVAQAMGMKIYRSKSGRWMRANYGEFNHRHGTPWFEPTRNWGYGGPIIEREGITVRRYTDALWDASIGRLDYVADGPTPLIAVMRCYVASKLGDEVEVPDELA